MTTTNIEPHLLEVLICPKSQQRLEEAPTELLDRLNKAIQAGSLKNNSQVLIEEPLEGGLLRKDGQILYIIRQGIPVMLFEEAIELTNLL